MGKWGDLARSLGSGPSRAAPEDKPNGAIGTIGMPMPWETDPPRPQFRSANGANGAFGTGGPHPARPAGQQLSSDQTENFHERAALAEFDGCLPRPHAEVLAALQSLDLGLNGREILNAVAERLEFLAKNGAIS